MTTDEATKSEGEVQAAALAERGEDITPARDRGVLKVRRGGLPGGSCLSFCILGCVVMPMGCIPSPLGSCSTSRAVGLILFYLNGEGDEHHLE